MKHDFGNPQDCACLPVRLAGMWVHVDPEVPPHVAYVLPDVQAPCMNLEPHVSHGYYPGTCPGVPE